MTNLGGDKKGTLIFKNEKEKSQGEEKNVQCTSSKEGKNKS